MSTSLVPYTTQLPMSKYVDDGVLNELATGGGFLPRIQLFGSSSDAVKEDKIGQGRYGLVKGKDEIIDLGKEVNVIPLSLRVKAVLMKDGKVTVRYNPQDPIFQDIKEGFKAGAAGHMCGPEYLLWIDDQKCFTTFHMASKSAVNASPDLTALVKSQAPATLRVTLAENKKGQKWHVPVISACSTPLDYPPEEDAMREANRFANPHEEKLEKAPETAPVGGR